MSVVSTIVRFTFLAAAIMQAPGFLKQDPTQEPTSPQEGDDGSRGYAVRGCLLGSILAILFWFAPIPVALVVWVLRLKGPFGDYMLMAIPFFITLPLIGSGI